MAWRDTLQSLRQELADVRSTRRQRVAEEDAELDRERQELTEMARTLGISELLTEMNATLLDGSGKLETVVAWADDTPDNEIVPAVVALGGSDQDDEEEADVISTFLSWEEGDELEIVVDLGLSDEGTYLQINGIEIRLEREALEKGLLDAFRDELDL